MNANLKLLYPSLSESILDVVENAAREDFIEYCNIEEVPDEASYLLLAMCQERVNRLYSEGLTGESVGGSTVSLLTDYSDQVKKRLKQYKRIRVI